jgi:hypothetical protein
MLLPVAAFGAFASTAATSPIITGNEFEKTMRKLWEDHITWTRLFIVSDLAQLPDSSLTAQRLLQNQTDIGDAVKPFYGEAAGNQLTALLNDHILTAAAILAAVREGDEARTQAEIARWYTNADEIGTFLGSANPRHWPADEMRAMMREHLDLTLAEASARFQGDYEADIAAYDQIHEHILGFADHLSDGIIQQFPQKFAPTRHP